MENQVRPGQSQILLAVSDDSNPLGTWYLQSISSVIDIDGVDHWADFLGVGMNADALFITNSMFPFQGEVGNGGVRLWIIGKDPPVQQWDIGSYGSRTVGSGGILGASKNDDSCAYVRDYSRNHRNISGSLLPFASGGHHIRRRDTRG